VEGGSGLDRYMFRTRGGKVCNIIQWKGALHVDRTDCIQEQIRPTRTDNQQWVTTQCFNETNHNTESNKTGAQAKIHIHNTHITKETIKKFKCPLNYCHNHGYKLSKVEHTSLLGCDTVFGQVAPNSRGDSSFKQSRKSSWIPHQRCITFQKA